MIPNHVHKGEISGKNTEKVESEPDGNETFDHHRSRPGEGGDGKGFLSCRLADYFIIVSPSYRGARAALCSCDRYR